MSQNNRVKSSETELTDKVVAINRVVKTTKGGRAFSFSALVVVGNGNGVVGQGLGKAKEVQEAIAKGIDDAKKNLIKVPVMNGTLPHDILSKAGADQASRKRYRCTGRGQHARRTGSRRLYRRTG